MRSSIGRNDGRIYVDLSLCTRFKFMNDRKTFLGVTQLNQIHNLLCNSVQVACKCVAGIKGIIEASMILSFFVLYTLRSLLTHSLYFSGIMGQVPT